MTSGCTDCVCVRQMPNTPHTPHTPHTPSNANTPAGGNGPPSVPPTESSTSQHNNTTTDVSNDHTSELPSDLNFDPAAVIDGEGTGQEALNVSRPFDLFTCGPVDMLTVVVTAAA